MSPLPFQNSLQNPLCPPFSFTLYLSEETKHSLFFRASRRPRAHQVLDKDGQQARYSRSSGDGSRNFAFSSWQGRCLNRGSPSSQGWGFRARASRASGSIKGTRARPPGGLHCRLGARIPTVVSGGPKTTRGSRKVSRATAVLPAPATRRCPRAFRASPCQPHSQVGTAHGS